MLILVTSLLFPEHLPGGPVSCFLSVRNHIFCTVIALVRSVSLQDCPIWRSKFSASLFLVTNVPIFRKILIFHFSELVAPGDIPNGPPTIFRHA